MPHLEPSSLNNYSLRLITPHYRLAIPEYLALVAIDVGRIDVAEVSLPTHSILVSGLLFTMRLSLGLFESLISRTPMFTPSIVPRGHFEGGKREFEGCLSILRTG